MADAKFEFILFDLIGTTISDSSKGESLILEAFQKSFQANGFEISYDQINQQRGRIKKEAIKIILKENTKDERLINKVYTDFIKLLNLSKSNFAEINGAKNVFRELKQKGIKIGVGSGLPLVFMHEIINQAGWQDINFDYLGSSEELGKGRPDPIMINDAQRKLEIHDRSRILKIGDTFVDIQEGKNAGVLTAGVLTGTQNRQTLEKFNPDYIFEDIKGLIGII